MTSEYLERTSYSDPNRQNNPVRSGTPTLAESERDMDQYYRPLERIHGSSLHGWGVASGLSVTATLNSATLSVLPGVAVDSKGQHIALAEGGNAEVGLNPTGFSTGATLKPVTASGVALPTSGLIGDKYLTMQFYETFDSNSYNSLGIFRYFHTPWLQLIDVAGFTNNGSQVVLAKVSFGSGATAGQVSALSQELRQATDLPTGSIHLQRMVTHSPSANVAAVDMVEAGVIRASDTGGIALTVPNATDEIHLERDDGTNFAKVSLEAEKIVARQGNGTESVVIDTPTGGITTSGNIAASNGTISTSNLTATGTIQGGNITSTGPISASAVNATGAIQGGSITATGPITTSGNIAANSGTISASAMTATGTIEGGSITSTGNISASGSMTASSATVNGPISASNLTTSGPVNASSMTVSSATVNGPISASSISTSGGVTVRGDLSVDVPSSGSPISAFALDVESFQTINNAIDSYFLQVRDIDAAPPDGLTHFCIRGDGNVGVGTTSPNNQLALTAQASFGGNTSNTGSEPVEVQGPGAGVSFYDRTGGATGRWVIYSNRTGGAGTETLRFWSAGDKVAITQQGNVNISGSASVNGDLTFSGNLIGTYGDATQAWHGWLYAPNGTVTFDFHLGSPRQLFAMIVLPGVRLLGGSSISGLAYIDSVDGNPLPGQADPANSAWKGQAQTIRFGLTSTGMEAWALMIVFHK